MECSELTQPTTGPARWIHSILVTVKNGAHLCRPQFTYIFHPASRGGGAGGGGPNDYSMLERNIYIQERLANYCQGLRGGGCNSNPFHPPLPKSRPIASQDGIVGGGGLKKSSGTGENTLEKSLTKDVNCF